MTDKLQILRPKGYEMRGEHTRSRYHPRRTLAESRQLAADGWYPFAALTGAENDEVFLARLSGFATIFPAFQEMDMLAAARNHNAEVEADAVYAADYIARARALADGPVAWGEYMESIARRSLP